METLKQLREYLTESQRIITKGYILQTINNNINIIDIAIINIPLIKTLFFTSSLYFFSYFRPIDTHSHTLSIFCVGQFVYGAREKIDFVFTPLS